MGLVREATSPIAPKITSPPTPTRGRRKDMIPSTTATIARIAPMPISKAALSCEPNVSIAKDLSHGGARSIAALPTAITGEEVPPTNPATSWATPSATAAESRPSNAPATRWRFTSGIRSRAWIGSSQVGLAHQPSVTRR